MKRSHGFSFLASLALVAAAACGDSNPAPAPDGGPGSDPNTVSTSSGTVHGGATASVRSFKGVPYAKPPVGPLRWAAPQAVVASTTTLDATAFGKHCPQPATPFGNAMNTDESCLFLNVYAPASATATSKLPVMFWIHGGALLVGESDEYDATPLVAQGVIVVTINYRLGLLGFMSHDSLTAEQGGSSGNYGFMDQQLALKWVQDNIANFGGDKTNVTIFGESAGGLSVHTQLVSTAAQGLFAKAIIESGAYSNAGQPTLAQAAAQGQTYAAAAQCASTPCSLTDLRSLTVANLLTAAASTSTWIPAIDGKVITQGIGAALTAGSYAKVPVMEGSNHDEYRLFVGLDEVQAAQAAGGYPAHDVALDMATIDQLAMTTFAPAGQAAVAQIVAAINASPSPALTFAAVGTNVIFSCNSRTSSSAMSGNAKTFVYEFSDPAAPQLYIPPVKSFTAFGAAHASELQYIWTLPPPIFPVAAMTSDQKILAAVMVSYWTNFAKNGDPNGSGLPTWPAFTTANQSILTLAPGTSGIAVTTTFAASHQCS